MGSFHVSMYCQQTLELQKHSLAFKVQGLTPLCIYVHISNIIYIYIYNMYIHIYIYIHIHIYIYIYYLFILLFLFNTYIIHIQIYADREGLGSTSTWPP